MRFNLGPLIGAAITAGTSLLSWYGVYRVALLAHRFLLK
jgi:hypothetical protein